MDGGKRHSWGQAVDTPDRRNRRLGKGLRPGRGQDTPGRPPFGAPSSFPPLSRPSGFACARPRSDCPYSGKKLSGRRPFLPSQWGGQRSHVANRESERKVKMCIRQCFLVGLFATVIGGNLSAVAHARLHRPVIGVYYRSDQPVSQKCDSLLADGLRWEKLWDAGRLRWFEEIKGRLPWASEVLFCRDGDRLGPLRRDVRESHRPRACCIVSANRVAALDPPHPTRPPPRPTRP